MTDTRPSDKNKTANRNATTAEHSQCGALELEYPAQQGLYGEIFTRYLPEVTDELIDTRAVRMLVEIEFNCRRTQKMFLGQKGIEAEHIAQLEQARRDLESLTWEVCDSIAYAHRQDWGYVVPGPDERQENIDR